MLRRKLSACISALTGLLIIFVVNSYQAQADATTPNHIKTEGVFAPPSGSNSTVSGDGTVQVTPNSGYQKGSIWSQETSKMDLTHNFSSLMYVNLGDKKGSAGDGMAFVMMNDPAKVTKWSQTTGASLGVWRDPSLFSTEDSEVKKSFAVEFDTYHNDDSLDGLASSQGGLVLPDHGHVAYGFPGVSNSYTLYKPLLSLTRVYGLKHNSPQRPANDAYLSDGTWHPFKINWNAKSKQLTYQFDSMPAVKVTLDPTTVFGTDQVYWGFTGSTGGSTELNQVVFSEVPGLNDLDSPTTITNANGEAISTNEDEEGTAGVKAYAGQTVHYKITPTDLVTSAHDVTNLKATIKLAHTTYKPGTLKLDGKTQSDSSWNGKTLSESLETLTHSAATKTIEFDATVDKNTTAGDESAQDTITYSSDLLLNKEFDLPYNVQPDIIEVKNPNSSSSYTISTANLDKMRTFSNSDAVAQALAKLIGLTAARKSDNASVGLDKFKTTTDALTAMKNLQAGGSVNLDFQAPDLGLNSTTVTYTITASKNTGTLKFGQVAPSSTFQDTKLGSSLAMHNQDWNTTIQDTRDAGSKWQVMLSISQPFTSITAHGGKRQPLLGNLEYLKADGTSVDITNSPVEVASGSNTASETTSITGQWTDKTGLAIKDISSGNYTDMYGGQLTWSLNDVPSN
ncbi:L-type lectin-domain containing protein [Latilactobacillus sakei]|uniref:L-type lectin-domain containing protein n=1 Tax=Latilactobacillus sakei TaxID=1599 RepID=UPI00241F73CD|nr:L-type lectin-domain containing protein [Latilactobacillus sakei]